TNSGTSTNTLTYDVTISPTTPRYDTITTSVFQAGQSNNIQQLPFFVVQEVPVSLSAVQGNQGVPVANLQVSVADAAGTPNPNNQSSNVLQFAQVSGLVATTVCSAAQQNTDGTY